MPQVELEGRDRAARFATFPGALMCMKRQEEAWPFARETAIVRAATLNMPVHLGLAWRRFGEAR